MDCLVIEPGHGSSWWTDCVWVDRHGKPNPKGRFVSGSAWEYDGGWNMPDDYRGQPVSQWAPRKRVLKVEGA